MNFREVLPIFFQRSFKYHLKVRISFIAVKDNKIVYTICLVRFFVVRFFVVSRFLCILFFLF